MSSSCSSSRSRGDSARNEPAPASIDRLGFDAPVHVTRPRLPDLDAYRDRLRPVWESHWLTNSGALEAELRQALCERLGVEHLSLFCNGTVALLISLVAADVREGEVITTPFTFPATVHALHWNRLRPVFCDVDEKTFNLDASQIERHVTDQTRAILPVHVFGNPCDVEAIDRIARAHDLPVVYDAAHAFGVELGGRTLLDHGDFSVLSFHATKSFTTGEGGAVISRSVEQQSRIEFLKNFGIADEETVIGPGINGKMSELAAAFGLLQLELLDEEIERRGRLAARYAARLGSVPGIVPLRPPPDVRPNHAYQVVLVDPDEYGATRDELHDRLRAFNVFARKYFHPLCSEVPPYRELPSAAPERLPVARTVASRVLCLPLYGELPEEAVERICSIIEALHGAA